MTATITYDNKSVRYFMIASIFWGIIGMLAGVLIATQLSFWQMNGKVLEYLTGGWIQSEGLSYLTFGRLRPLHTNAVIFAFVGNMMFAGIYYSTQRLCKCRTASDVLTRIHFWGWNAIIVAAALTLPAGLTRGKEYAELIWPINIAVVVIWVVFGVNFFWTLLKRNEPSLYVALWFYIATILTVAMLYVVNHLSIPTSWTHSYSLFGGVQDGLVQWWYGHNAVAFFLTTPILGIMYYYIPKASGRPVYSYRLSIIHFWSLVFIYIWAGPHHLLNTALPQWLQYLGMFFSLMLWAPSWGGMLNGLFTLRGAWDTLRTDPVIKFLAAGVTFYGMATFEGPLMAITAVNRLSHYTDWTVGHVHSGALGWNGMMAAGMFYWLAPRLWRTSLWSKSLANMHFWIAFSGILIYIVALWFAGITQGMMLNQLSESGTSLQHPFLATLKAIQPYFIARSIGGGLYLCGFVMLAINVFMTARSGVPGDDTVEVTVLEKGKKDNWGLFRALWGDPMVHVVLVILFVLMWFFLPPYADRVALVMAAVLGWKAIRAFKDSNGAWTAWHERLLDNYLPFTVLVFIAAAIGGAVQIVPTVIVKQAKNLEGRVQMVYTPLELAGRDVFVQEGCYNCHSQMVRTLTTEVMRYGRPGKKDDWSHLGESIYDHPFQWGSKRTGPDLAHLGGELVSGSAYQRSGKWGNVWHYQHLCNPRDTSEGSNMPAYAFLFEREADIKALPSKIQAQVLLGVPWDAKYRDVTGIEEQVAKQSQEIAKSLEKEARMKSADGRELEGPELVNALAKTQGVALIAYLQKLGISEEVKRKDSKGSSSLNPDSHR